jgi:hydroxymethylglutaryl-CoA synthase
VSPGIAGVGAYAPRTRLPGDAVAEAWGQFKASGIEETAVPGPDEDVLTMGYEAARNALDAAGVAGETLGAVGFATTNPPVEEEALLPRFGEMLAVPETAETTVYTGSLTAGVRALRGAARAVESTGPALVVASDAPRGELDEALGQGAGAAATAPRGSASPRSTGRRSSRPSLVRSTASRSTRTPSTPLPSRRPTAASRTA